MPGGERAPGVAAGIPLRRVDLVTATGHCKNKLVRTGFMATETQSPSLFCCCRGPKGDVRRFSLIN